MGKGHLASQPLKNIVPNEKGRSTHKGQQNIWKTNELPKWSNAAPCKAIIVVMA
jgi:hypothetical protein